jgi:N utilization substance protein B
MHTANKIMINQNTIARLAAVQLLYSLEVSKNKNSNQALNDIIEYYSLEENLHKDLEIDEEIKIKLNKAFLIKLAVATINNLKNINCEIGKYLKLPYTIENINIMLLSLLRIAIAELIYITDTPFKVVINEFTNIASSFLASNDVAFINAILDNYAKDINEKRVLINAL